MQIAINVAIFVLGYSIAFAVALRPKKARKEVVTFLHKLRFVANGIVSEAPPSMDEKTLLQSGERDKALVPEPAKLMTKAQVEATYDHNTWQGLAYEDFKRVILARGAGMKTFPCVYATMGYRGDEHRYVFLESDDPSAPRNVRQLAPALLEYLRTSTTLGPNTSLVVICAPSEKLRTVEEYNNKFWDMLRGLRIWDPKPWPAEIPDDTESSKWCFCFDGEPVFPVMLTPAHAQRWSRHMPVPLIALQPKWVLDNLLGTPEKREAAQMKVRKLLGAYDQIDISPDLTSYGQEGTSEIRQLCLMDQNEPVDCPYRSFET